MKKIYLDQASTSYPKAPQVAEAMLRYMTELGANINRGCYEDAYSAEEIVYETRELLCELFHFSPCKNAIFTNNVTTSLNMLLKGLLKPGDHALVSSMEHNAVMRPLVQLQKTGVTFDRIPCRRDGSMILEEAERLIKPETKAIITLHASNVCGTRMPLSELGAICRKHHLFFLVDSAQTAGIVPVDMEEMHIDALAFTGHKGLRGPQGTGGFLVTEELAAQIEPLISGGTGSISHTEDVPLFLPDRFEAGTLNLPGIFGLHQALLYLKKGSVNASMGASINASMSASVDAICEKELALTGYFLEKLQELDGDGSHIRIIGKKDLTERTAVVSIQTPGMEMAEVAYQLDTSYGIMTRVGLHCAPHAHMTLGTYPEGTIRFSFGPENTVEEIDAAVQALKEILKL